MQGPHWRIVDCRALSGELLHLYRYLALGLLNRPMHRAVVTAIWFTNVSLLTPCSRQPYSKNFPNHDINSQLKLSLFLGVILQNCLAVTLKTYSATNVPGKESLNPFGLKIVAGFVSFAKLSTRMRCSYTRHILILLATVGFYMGYRNLPIMVIKFSWHNFM